MTKWLSHVKATMKQMKSEKASMGKKWFSHVLKTAKKSYKKHKGGEEKEEPSVPDVPDMPAAVDGAGKKRRRGGKTQRRSRK
jgi:hypothetical protein